MKELPEAILHILVGVRSMDDVQKFDKHKLKEAGYYHLGRVGFEGKEVFAKFSNLENLRIRMSFMLWNMAVIGGENIYSSEII